MENSLLSCGFLCSHRLFILHQVKTKLALVGSLTLAEIVVETVVEEMKLWRSISFVDSSN